MRRLHNSTRTEMRLVHYVPLRVPALHVCKQQVANTARDDDCNCVQNDDVLVRGYDQADVRQEHD
jgi:hypothetical protein